MTKQDFADQFDYEALSHALRIRVHQTDGLTYDARVAGYWPSGPSNADIIDVHTTHPDVNTTDQGYIAIAVPSPDITSIEILSAADEKPDWGTHPEVGIWWPPIDDLYAKHRS